MCRVWCLQEEKLPGRGGRDEPNCRMEDKAYVYSVYLNVSILKVFRRFLLRNCGVKRMLRTQPPANERVAEPTLLLLGGM